MQICTVIYRYFPEIVIHVFMLPEGIQTQKNLHFILKGRQKRLVSIHIRVVTSITPLPGPGGGFAPSGSPDFAFSVCNWYSNSKFTHINCQSKLPGLSPLNITRSRNRRCGKEVFRGEHILKNNDDLLSTVMGHKRQGKINTYGALILIV